MNYQSLIVLTVITGLFALPTYAQPEEQCPPQQGVALQVLGSGGPVADDARASSGYIVWVDGKSRILIDAGGGTFLRFGEAAASFADLDFMGISHFHTDHSADLPALLKSGYFSARERSLPVAGPDGNGTFPGLETYLQHMLDGNAGAYGYLSGYLDGTGGLPALVPFEVSRNPAGPVTLMGNAQSEVQVDGLHVPHGIVPALAFRVRIGSTVIVFAGDQNGDDPRFIEFAKSAALLVMHMPVAEDAAGVARKLHAPPGVIAGIASQSGAKALLLSHFMARSLLDLDANVKLIRSNYQGRVIVADDLDCIVTGA